MLLVGNVASAATCVCVCDCPTDAVLPGAEGPGAKGQLDVCIWETIYDKPRGLCQQ